MEDRQAAGYDKHSKIARPLFKDPENGDYGVLEKSPALELGFKNFPMDAFGHQMTRISPFGGDFSEMLAVTIKADARAGNGGTLHYTLDGSEPGVHSPVYSSPIPLTRSTILKARSFDAAGQPIDFTQEAKFTKVEKVVYPSWYQTLLNGQYRAEVEHTEKKAAVAEILGAVMVDIADDPDLIDASGGYNFGCYIQSIDPAKGKIWLEAGLANEWVIQALNNEKVEHSTKLKQLLEKYSSKRLSITAVRNYKTKTVELKLP
jgi:hypothetical protein